jgi:hypothetical protein
MRTGEELHGLGVRNLPGERNDVMAEFCITYNGRHYLYDRYRYDRLDDAVAYARLLRARAAAAAERMPLPSAEYVDAPADTDRPRMEKLAISYQDGIYRLGPYRYDRLADAINYAKRQGPVATPSRAGAAADGSR